MKHEQIVIELNEKAYNLVRNLRKIKGNIHFAIVRSNKKELNLSRMIKKIEAKVPEAISCTLS